MLLLQSQPNPVLYVETIHDSPYHFEKLFRLCCDIAQLPDDHLKITVDFHYCKFLGHHGVAFLGGLAHLIQHRGGHIDFQWDTLSDKIHMNLAQNGFLQNFNCNWGPWNGNSIPYRCDIKHDSATIGDYLRYQWLGKGWVNVSPGLRDAIAGQVSEIYLNAFEHSHSKIGVFSCGQHYPNIGMLHLTVVDFGIGIPTSVRSLSKNSDLTTEQAFVWAFQPGTSTSQTSVSRGMGLNLLQNFVTKNQGKLTIFSNDGCITIDDNGVRHRNTCTNFPGALVDIAFRCDETYYCLASEVPSVREPLF